MTSCNICFNEFIIDNKKDISIALRCETPKCKSIICNDCEIKLQEQLENSNQIIKCPLCRQPYFKNHFRWSVLEGDLKRDWLKEKKRELSYKIKFNKELIEKLEKEIVQSLEELSVYE